MVSFRHKPTIVGEHVVLRPMVGDDAAAMFADFDDEEAMRLTGTHTVLTLEQIERWCATRAETDDRLDLAVTARMTGEWLGEAVINDWDADNRSCGFRIALSASARNRGIGTEATRLVVDYVFDQISSPPVNRIELEVFAFNPRAIAAYERAGFQRDGVRRDALRWDEEYIDALVMSIIRSDPSSATD